MEGGRGGAGGVIGHVRPVRQLEEGARAGEALGTLERSLGIKIEGRTAGTELVRRFEPFLASIDLRVLVLPTLRRRPLLALLLAVGLGIGPAASAFCAHLAAGHGTHAGMDRGMGHDAMEGGHTEAMEMGEPVEPPPCHDDPMPVEQSPVDLPPVDDGADCEAPCCTAAPDPISLTVSPSVPDLTVVGEVNADVVWGAAPTRTAIGDAERPRSSRWYLDIQRIRL